MALAVLALTGGLLRRPDPGTAEETAFGPDGCLSDQVLRRSIMMMTEDGRYSLVVAILVVVRGAVNILTIAASVTRS